STYTTLWRLATLHEEQGQFLRAEQCLRRAVKGLSTALGEDHPDFVRCLALLAELKERMSTSQEPGIVDCEADCHANLQAATNVRVGSEVTATARVNRSGTPNKLGWAVRLIQRMDQWGGGRRRQKRENP